MTRRRFIAAAATAGVAGCAGGETLAPGHAAEQTHPPLGRFVEAAGERLHVLEKGDGPPVVLIHGASGNLRDFSFDLMDRIAAQGFRAVAFDRPGLGYSTRPRRGGDDPMIQARILIAGARAIDATPAVVVGHSYGGAVALAWALQAPQTTRGVVSVAGATHPWGGGAGLAYTLGSTMAFSGLVRRALSLVIDADEPEAVLKRIFRPNPAPEGYARYVGVGLALRPGTFRNNAADLAALNGKLETQAPRYGQLAAPVEVIHGTADRTVWASVHAEPLARDAPQGRLTLLDGVGHMPHHVAPEAVIAAVQRLSPVA